MNYSNSQRAGVILNFTAVLLGAYFLESSAEKIENADLGKGKVLYLAYELCEAWYYFVSLLHYGYAKDDKKNLVSYIILPIQLLYNFVSDEISLTEKDEFVINAKVEMDERIAVEKDFIFSELGNVIDKNHYESQFKVCINYNILEKIQ